METAFVNEKGRRSFQQGRRTGKKRNKLYHVQLQILYGEWDYYVYLKCINKVWRKI